MRFLSRQELISFFLEQNLLPGDTETHYITDTMRFVRILFNARDESELFGKYIRKAILPLGNDRYVFMPNTWEELYDGYYSYMAETSKAAFLADV